MNRRQWWMGGAATVALLAGGWVGWSSRRDGPVPEPWLDFWQQRWPDPHGVPVAMKAFSGRPLLVNFWATWCPPCLQELPLLDAFAREQAPKGWQVLGLAVDRVEAVARFVQQHPLTFPVAVPGPAGLAWSEALGHTPGGGLPFSVAFNAAGQPVARHAGVLSPADLARWRDSV